MPNQSSGDTVPNLMVSTSCHESMELTRLINQVNNWPVLRRLGFSKCCHDQILKSHTGVGLESARPLVLRDPNRLLRELGFGPTPWEEEPVFPKVFAWVLGSGLVSTEGGPIFCAVYCLRGFFNCGFPI